VETTQRKYKTQLAEVEARAECGSCGYTGTGVGAVQPPKFDGSISWSVSDGSLRLWQTITTGRPARKPRNRSPR
jgi:hypothetical protein